VRIRVGDNQLTSHGTEVAYRERLAGLQERQHVVRHASALIRRWLGAGNVQPRVHLHDVTVDDICRMNSAWRAAGGPIRGSTGGKPAICHPARQLHAQLALAAAGGSNHRHQARPA